MMLMPQLLILCSALLVGSNALSLTTMGRTWTVFDEITGGNWTTSSRPEGGLIQLAPATDGRKACIKGAEGLMALTPVGSGVSSYTFQVQIVPEDDNDVGVVFHYQQRSTSDYRYYKLSFNSVKSCVTLALKDPSCDSGFCLIGVSASIYTYAPTLPFTVTVGVRRLTGSDMITVCVNGISLLEVESPVSQDLASSTDTFYAGPYTRVSANSLFTNFKFISVSEPVCTVVMYNNHYYQLITTPASFTSALQAAEGAAYQDGSTTFNGHLATVVSAGELDAVARLQALIPSSAVWVAGANTFRDAATNHRIWSWVSGPEKDLPFWSSSGVFRGYAPWGTLDPATFPYPASSVVKNGTLGYSTPSSSLPYVIEYSPPEDVCAAMLSTYNASQDLYHDAQALVNASDAKYSQLNSSYYTALSSLLKYQGYLAACDESSAILQDTLDVCSLNSTFLSTSLLNANARLDESNSTIHNQSLTIAALNLRILALEASVNTKNSSSDSSTSCKESFFSGLFFIIIVGGVGFIFGIMIMGCVFILCFTKRTGKKQNSIKYAEIDHKRGVQSIRLKPEDYEPPNTVKRTRGMTAQNGGYQPNNNGTTNDPVDNYADPMRGERISRVSTEGNLVSPYAEVSDVPSSLLNHLQALKKDPVYEEPVLGRPDILPSDPGYASPINIMPPPRSSPSTPPTPSSPLSQSMNSVSRLRRDDSFEQDMSYNSNKRPTVFKDPRDRPTLVKDPRDPGRYEPSVAKYSPVLKNKPHLLHGMGDSVDSTRSDFSYLSNATDMTELEHEVIFPHSTMQRQSSFSDDLPERTSHHVSPQKKQGPPVSSRPPNSDRGQPQPPERSPLTRSVSAEKMSPLRNQMSHDDGHHHHRPPMTPQRSLDSSLSYPYNANQIINGDSYHRDHESQQFSRKNSTDNSDPNNVDFNLPNSPEPPKLERVPSRKNRHAPTKTEETDVDHHSEEPQPVVPVYSFVRPANPIERELQAKLQRELEMKMINPNSNSNSTPEKGIEFTDL